MKNKDLTPVIDLSDRSEDKYKINLGNYEIKIIDGELFAVRTSQYPKTYGDTVIIVKK